MAMKIDDTGCVHIDLSDTNGTLKELGGLKAKEYELLLAAGIKSDGDNIRFGYGLAWIWLRRREPSLTWEDAQDRIIADFIGLADEPVEDPGEVDEVDPTSADS